MLDAYPWLKGKDYDMASEMLLDMGDSFLFILDEWDYLFHNKFMSEENIVLPGKEW